MVIVIIYEKNIDIRYNTYSIRSIASFITNYIGGTIDDQVTEENATLTLYIRNIGNTSLSLGINLSWDHGVFDFVILNKNNRSFNLHTNFYRVHTFRIFVSKADSLMAINVSTVDNSDYMTVIIAKNENGSYSAVHYFDTVLNENEDSEINPENWRSGLSWSPTINSIYPLSFVRCPDVSSGSMFKGLYKARSAPFTLVPGTKIIANDVVYDVLTLTGFLCRD